ncbi:hypothetical protein [Methyloglobulus sp.]|uniref:hypothetical protein n=1 Tax=Methyloglobulus sp. TaxID=2518622 RepID=UPI0032B81B8B
MPLVGYGTGVAGRLGQPQALAVALSFCRLFGQDILKTSFRKNSDSPLLYLNGSCCPLLSFTVSYGVLYGTQLC